MLSVVLLLMRQSLLSAKDGWSLILSKCPVPRASLRGWKEDLFGLTTMAL